MATSPFDPPSSKLTPPTLRQGVVQRRRLFRGLDEATRAASLTLVLGYAGAGKTVLVTSWVAARPDARFAWLSCDDADTDQVRFWTGLVAAIRRAEPSIGDDTLDRIELDGAVSVDAVGVLSDELRTVADPLTIVLDDLHDAADRELWPLLSAFIEWLPAQHRVVIAARSEPTLPLHRWRVEGRLAELRNEQLTFDDDEAAAMLGSLGARVDRSEVSMLAKRTEGWAAGLQLAGLSVRDRDDTAAYLLDVAATDRNLVDYLTAEVLEHQPPDVTDFLLATSILRELDPRVCRAITGDADAHARLRDIERRGLFLVPLDREGRRYRYHHLFAELLQRQLHLQDEPRELALHRTASDWYEAERQLDLAVFHAVRAKRTTRAVSLLRERPVGAYLSGAPLHPTRLIDLLDDATLAEERELALEFALNVGIDGSLDQAGRWIRRLAHLNDQRPDAIFQARLTAIRALWEMARGGAERSMAHMTRARPLLDTTDDLAPGLVAAEARNRQYLDDLDGVRQLTNDWPIGTLPPMAAVILLSAHGAIEGDAGFLHIADRVARSALELADEVGTRRHHGAGEALRVVGAVHLERLELDEAEAMLEQALRTVERDRPALEVLCLVDHTWLLVERRRIDDAFETIARAETLAEHFDMSPALLARIKAASTHLHLLVGATNEAERKVQQMPHGTRRALAEARVALGRHLPTVAEGILDSIETHRWPRYELDLALLRAQTQIALDRPTADVGATIERALGVADEHLFTRALLNERSDLDNALLTALRRAPSGSHRHAIGQHLRARAPVPRVADSRSAGPPPSNRELEILRFLATGLSNREIAAELYISLNTMKTHTRSLYRRLGASSRSQAVAAGRARGLL